MSECCKILSPAEWDKKEIVWRDKPFLKSHYFAFLHVPVNIGAKISEGMKKIDEAGLGAEQMVLSKNDGIFGADILIPIKNKTDIFEVDLITGRFLTRLFEGHYGDMRKWIRETRIWCREKQGLAAGRGKGWESEEFIFWYATCPKCAKKRGDKAQVVVFAKVE
ncbi:MAG TPA: hydrolase [Candidatus Bathyarchaeia archaeon]|nr:hydrolase [Candidatus Bathyarchaeia archaeon]